MISGETAVKIAKDVANGVEPDSSYDEEMRVFYDSVEEDFEAYRAEHPDAVLDVRE